MKLTYRCVACKRKTVSTDDSRGILLCSFDGMPMILHTVQGDDVTKGGKREGAGRKPESESGPKGTKCVKLTQEVLAYLDTIGKTCSTTIEALIRKSPGFKAWANDSDGKNPEKSQRK